MAKPQRTMSKKQMIKELTPTLQQLKRFHKMLKAQGLTDALLQQGRLDSLSEH
jgi:hypothetical protein